MKTNEQPNPEAIANEFLDQWEKAHAVDLPNYDRLATKYAIYTGQQVSIGDADAIGKALHASRKARGWPDPNPTTIEPSIEAAIMALWRSGLRNSDPNRERDE